MYIILGVVVTSADLFRRLYSVILGTVLILFVSACSDREPEPEPKTTEFEVTISSPSNGVYIKGNVDIEAKAAGETPIAFAQVYVDNILIKEITGNGVNVPWDSQTVADGSHTIRVNATDATGREGSVELAIEVLNTFVTLNIPPNYVGPGEKVLFFFSDKDGNVLSVAEAQNDTQLVFETPSTLVPGSMLVFSTFSQNSLAESIESYSEFNLGTYSLKRRQMVSNAGSHQITVTSVPSGITSLGLHSVNSEPIVWGFLNGPEISAYAKLATSTADVFLNYVRREQQDVKYKLLMNLKVGENTTIDLATFTTMSLQEAASAPDATFSMSQINGLTDVEDDHSALKVWEAFAVPETGDPTKFQMFYPGTTFQKYVVTNVYSTTTTGYKNQYVGATPPTIFTPIDASILSVRHENAVVTVSTSGICDYAQLNSFSNSASGRSFSWRIFVAPGEHRSITVPKVPEEVKALTANAFESLRFKNGIICDYETLNGYQAYLQFWLNTPDKLYLSFKEKNPVGL